MEDSPAGFINLMDFFVSNDKVHKSSMDGTMMTPIDLPLDDIIKLKKEERKEKKKLVLKKLTRRSRGERPRG